MDRLIKTILRLAVLISGFFVLLLGHVLPIEAQTTVNGIVFRDYNMNAVRDTGAGFTEPLVDGVEVRAFDPTNAVIACDVSGPFDCAGGTDGGAPGAYALVLPAAISGERIRLEFTRLPDALNPGLHRNPGADGAGTTVRFFTAGGAPVTDVDLPLASIGDFCGETVSATDGPTLVTSCQVVGDQISPDPANPMTALLAFDYDSPVNDTYTFLKPIDDVGTAYGLAYHRLTNTLFLSAYLKRHAGTNYGSAGTSGFGGLGNIYVMRGVDAAAPLNVIDLTAPPYNIAFGTDGRIAPWDYLRPGGNIDNPGKNGIGDIDVSEDGTILWLTNLFDRRVYRLSIAYGTPTPTGFLPDPPTFLSYDALGPFDPGCQDGVARPFGIGVQDRNAYIGVVCTAENGGTSADLSAHVYRCPQDAITCDEVLALDLGFPRGCQDRGDTSVTAVCTSGRPADWQPWQAVIDPPAWGNAVFAGAPQPMLSDIEFDNDGNMILGFRDRWGDQIGNGTYGNPPEPTILWHGISSGDVLRACPDPENDGQYIIEGATSGVFTCPTNPPLPDQSAEQGPARDEFFFADSYPPNGDALHEEVAVGALIHVGGMPDITATFMDPLILGTHDGGIRWLNAATGDFSRGYRIYNGVYGSRETFGKLNGLGDLESICPPPQMEIGNYVWIEDTRDGVQGTGIEFPASGVLLELVDPASGQVIAQSTTDASGHYYFNETDAVWDSNGNGVFGEATDLPFWDINGNGVQNGDEPEGIMAYTSYRVRVASSNFIPGGPLDGYEVTQINAPGSLENGFNMTDSDGISVDIMTGAFGVNNHTLDFGFVLAPPDQPTPTPTVVPPVPPTTTPRIEKAVAPGSALAGDTVTWTITLHNDGPDELGQVTFVDSIAPELEIIDVRSSAGQVSIADQEVRFQVDSMAVGETITVDIETVVRGDVDLPFSIENQVGDASSVLLTVTRLPDTGESPDWRVPALVFGIFVLILFVAGLGWMAPPGSDVE